MSVVLLLEVPESLLTMFEAQAAAGMSWEGWISTCLAALAEEPVTWPSYVLRGSSATSAALSLIRLPGSGEVLLRMQQLEVAQQVIAQAAKALVDRTRPDDREIAKSLLKKHFEVVLETLEPDR